LAIAAPSLTIYRILLVFQLRAGGHAACYPCFGFMRLRLPRRWLLLGAVVAFGCYSPTLPLPPPLAPDITETETGAYRLQGNVVPNAQVFALNSRTLLVDGEQSSELGAYDFELHNAQAGDEIQFWYQAGTDLSPPTAFELPSFAPGGSGGMGGSAGAGGIAGGGASGSGG
jgi:hypothetical protein